MKVVVVGTLLAAVAIAGPAEAKTKRRHVAQQQQAAAQPFANPFGFNPFLNAAAYSPAAAGTRTKMRHRRAAQRNAATQVAANPFNLGAFAGASGHSLISTARAYSGRNPTNRSRQWCGEFMGLVVRQNGGKVPEGYAKASSWAKLPRTTERVGAVAVMPHHVGIVTGQCEGGGVQIISGNFGRAKVGEGCIPRSRIIAFVQP
ncbi:MAG TPA: hypothetical protein VNQ34_06305 [Xanthobacteraceae bacterium]|jgi:hypothetical protein|nr:hypothetical protein [Xanthobacteraceae bacterium]